jgi:FkbM family methyltransferase
VPVTPAGDSNAKLRAGAQRVRSRVGTLGRTVLPPAARDRIRGSRPRRPAGPSAKWSDLASRQDLDAAYRLFLGRPADPHGLRSYTPYVESGWFTVTDLAARFVTSVEFRNRLGAELGWSDGVPEAVDLLDGTRLYVRSTDSSVGAAIKEAREYEPHVVARMRRELAAGQTFVDVGASLGYFTVLAGDAVGPTGRVVSCEPGPQNHSVLLLNVVSRGLDNVTIHRLAVGERRDVLLYSGSGGNGAVGPYGGDPTSLATHDLVETAPLDELLADLDRVDIIKADVEGAEGLVLRGAHRTLAAHHPVLFLEFSPPSLVTTSGMTGRELLDDLGALGYRFEVLGDTAPAATSDLSPAEVLEVFEQVGGDHLDLCATVSGSGGGPARQ